MRDFCDYFSVIAESLWDSLFSDVAHSSFCKQFCVDAGGGQHCVYVVDLKIIL
jgi:hypothetical protein